MPTLAAVEGWVEQGRTLVASPGETSTVTQHWGWVPNLCRVWCTLWVPQIPDTWTIDKCWGRGEARGKKG